MTQISKGYAKKILFFTLKFIFKRCFLCMNYLTSLFVGLARRKAMFDVRCSGDELALKYCHHKTPRTGRCRYYEMASVECSDSK